MAAQADACAEGPAPGNMVHVGICEGWSAVVGYAPRITDSFGRAVTYVGKILRGRTLVDLPVEQPMKFDFSFNLKTAKQIVLTIPPNVFVRADKVIK